MHGESFEALLRRVREGSQEAAWEFVERYGDHIRSVVHRRKNARLRSFIDSEDFVQQVWKSLFIGDDLDDISNPDQLVGLLKKMARNKVIDEVRRRTETIKHQLPAHGEPAQLEAGNHVAPRSQTNRPSQYAMARERWTNLLRNESEQVQRIVELRLAKHTYDEIAAELGVNERTVRRAMERLLERLEDDSADDLPAKPSGQ